MTYEISEQDFLNLVANPRCSGTEKNNGRAKDGHADCDWCKGNYFVGGECNYGGGHKMADDLRRINQNFKQFDKLENRKITLDGSKNAQSFNNAKQSLIIQFQALEKKCQDDASKEEFFGGTCIGIDGTHEVFLKRIQTSLRSLARDLRGYIEKLQSITWEQLKSFQEKKEKLAKLQQQANQLLEEWKNETDPIKKAQLYAAYQDKLQESKNFLAEIRKDPVYDLFSDEKENELKDIIKKIWSGETTFLKFTKKDKEKLEENDKYFGILPKKWGKRLLRGSTDLIILLIVYWIYRWIRGKT